MSKHRVSRSIGEKKSVGSLRFLHLSRQVPCLSFSFHSFFLNHSSHLAAESVDFLGSCVLSLKWAECRRASVIAAGDVSGSQGANSVTLLCLRLLIIDAIVSFFALTLFTEEVQTLIFFFCLCFQMHCWKLSASTKLSFSFQHFSTL